MATLTPLGRRGILASCLGGGYGGRFKRPTGQAGWASLCLGIFDWWSRIEFAHGKSQWVHSMMPAIEGVVSSVWFTPRW